MQLSIGMLLLRSFRERNPENGIVHLTRSPFFIRSLSLSLSDFFSFNFLISFLDSFYYIFYLFLSHIYIYIYIYIIVITIIIVVGVILRLYINTRDEKKGPRRRKRLAQKCYFHGESSIIGAAIFITGGDVSVTSASMMSDQGT